MVNRCYDKKLVFRHPFAFAVIVPNVVTVIAYENGTIVGLVLFAAPDSVRMYTIDLVHVLRSPLELADVVRLPVHTLFVYFKLFKINVKNTKCRYNFLTCAAITRWRSAINVHFAQTQSRHRQYRLWPFSALTWFIVVKIENGIRN